MDLSRFDTSVIWKTCLSVQHFWSTDLANDTLRLIESSYQEFLTNSLSKALLKSIRITRDTQNILTAIVTIFYAIMKQRLFEVERKFHWRPSNLRLLLTNAGHPPFPSCPVFEATSFRDTYFDDEVHSLSKGGLWIRRRNFLNLDNKPRGAMNSKMTDVWEAKRALPGSSFRRSAYEETTDRSRIVSMIKELSPSTDSGMHNDVIPTVGGMIGPENQFGLKQLCQFITYRRSFHTHMDAPNKDEATGPEIDRSQEFNVVLDETDFGHAVGEVEIMALDAVKAHFQIDAFLEKYSWFFETGGDEDGDVVDQGGNKGPLKVKGKLTAYFEKFPPKIRGG